MFGIDLSRVDFSAWGLQYDFAPGLQHREQGRVRSRCCRTTTLAANGAPPLLMIGDNLPPADAVAAPICRPCLTSMRA